MVRDAGATERLRSLLKELISITEAGKLHWERQVGSAHRYARLKDNLLILGPAQPAVKKEVPRYLFITPFDSPDCIEINSKDEELGKDMLMLVATVEEASKREPPTDPFAITEELLSRLTD